MTSTTTHLPRIQADGAYWLVFTDLDGTLLSHNDYRYDAAKPLMARLEAQGIPVHIASSKTFAESSLYYQEWGVSRPMVVENGAAIAWPKGGKTERDYTLTPTLLAYKHLRRTLVQLRDRHGWDVQGFGDWTAQQVVDHTGLDLASAQRAQQRTASEPVLFHGYQEQLNSFRKALQGQGLRLVRGGRFHHIMGDADKADGVRRVREHYMRLLPSDAQIKVLCLGDSENDRAMLESADCTIVVQRHDGTHLQLNKTQAVHYSDAASPQGWAQGVTNWLDS